MAILNFKHNLFVLCFCPIMICFGMFNIRAGCMSFIESKIWVIRTLLLNLISDLDLNKKVLIILKNVLGFIWTTIFNTFCVVAPTRIARRKMHFRTQSATLVTSFAVDMSRERTASDHSYQFSSMINHGISVLNLFLSARNKDQKNMGLKTCVQVCF